MNIVCCIVGRRSFTIGLSVCVCVHVWAPRILPLSVCSVLLSVLFVCTWVWVQVVAIARML